MNSIYNQSINSQNNIIVVKYKNHDFIWRIENISSVKRKVLLLYQFMKKYIGLKIRVREHSGVEVFLQNFSEIK